MIQIFWTLAGHLLLPAIVIEGCSFLGALKRADKIATGNLLTIGFGEVGIDQVALFVNSLVGGLWRSCFWLCICLRGAPFYRLFDVRFLVVLLGSFHHGSFYVYTLCFLYLPICLGNRSRSCIRIRSPQSSTTSTISCGTSLAKQKMYNSYDFNLIHIVFLLTSVRSDRSLHAFFHSF